jgi:arylformamidase
MRKIHKPYRYPADQAALDALFNNRARWPQDAATVVESWAKAGEATLALPGWRCDVPYGPGPRQTLDILVPPRKDARRAPLFAFIHGGYWQMLEKKHVRGLAGAFAARGIAFATIEYALCPDVSVEAIARQIQAAFAYLWREAPRLGCDPQRIHVGGHSAGGHLATMLCTMADLPVRPAGCFSVSGVYDLAPLRRSYQQPVLRLSAREVAANSPLSLRPLPGTPVRVTVGSDELGAFLGQQADLVANWRGAGAKVEVVPATGLNHFTIVEKVADFRHPIGKAALAMIGGA